jgi:glycosyltransferase involved in cell wall biosynthesis
LAAKGNSIVLAGLGPEPSQAQAAEARSVATLTWLNTPPDWMTRDENDLDRLPGELGDLVSAHAIDLVHLNAPAQAVGLDFSCPVVVVSHSCVVTWLHAVRGDVIAGDWAWQRRRNQAGFERAAAVIAPSQSHADVLQTCYGAIARQSVVHNGALPCPATEGRDAFVFAAARWWDEGKNADTLDRAAAIAQWPVYAAGSLNGPDGQRARINNCVALGSVDYAEVRRLMAKAGIFVSTSVYEPFGLAVLEAAMSGTPLLLADIPTYREIWNGAALFFEARDAEALAGCIARLAGDEELRRQLGNDAAKRARKFSLPAQARAMSEIYNVAAVAAARR